MRAAPPGRDGGSDGLQHRPCGAGPRLRRGIGVEHGSFGHLALAEPHALPVFEIDGGKQDHGFQFRKLAISASPSFWLFSGWNWLPAMLSLATKAVTSPP